VTARIALPAPAEIAAFRRAHPDLFSKPLARRWRDRAFALVFAGLLVFGLWWIDVAPIRIWTGASRLGLLIRLMFPPATGGAFATYCYALVETLAMAFVGTCLASVAALPIGFLAARNIAPNRFFHFGLRRILDGFRGVDALIWAMIFVGAVGMGPFAGVLAIAFSDFAFLSKTYAEAIENVDRKPVEGARAAGAGRFQVVRFAIAPQILPVILSSALYYLEFNVRGATVLGIVGAGGIGLQLSQRILVNDWDQACFIIIMMLVAVAGLDFLSRWIRMRVIAPRPAPAAKRRAPPAGDAAAKP
jgi:phosphonate transport system permease protein